jgi:5-methylcytosine-specific restriction protein A
MSKKRKNWRDAKRPQAHKRGYDHKWRKRRKIFLEQNPLCVTCLGDTPSRVTAARVVDHVIPHKGDTVLFWDESNWQALCVFHHSSVKQREEKGRARPQIGDDGWPITE